MASAGSITAVRTVVAGSGKGAVTETTADCPALILPGKVPVKVPPE